MRGCARLRGLVGHQSCAGDALALKRRAESAPFRVCVYGLAVALRLHLVIVRDSAAWARAHHTQSVRHASAHALHADILVRVYAHQKAHVAGQ